MGRVFSDRERSDASPSSGESMYAFLDRVAGPFWDRIRGLIEDWVNDYCPDDQAEMVTRLQKGNDIAFTAAYWELLLYHGLKALGFEVTCHPEVNIQVPGLGVAACNRGLRSSVGRGVAVAGERGFRDDCGL